MLTASATAFTWAVVNLPFALYSDTNRGWQEFFARNTSRGADPDSLYNVASHFTGWSGFDGNLGFGEIPQILNVVSLVLFLALCAGIAYVGLSAPTRPRVAQLAFLVVAAFLLTNKVWSPQYSLWLIPLAVLAVPRWKALLAWMTLDALVWAPRMMFYLGENNKGLPEDWFLGAVVIRDLAVIGLCALIVYDIYRPAHDLSDGRATTTRAAGSSTTRRTWSRCGGGSRSDYRSARRRTSFNPDQVASIAHTLTSTRPLASACSRTTSSVRSVGTPEARLGQAIHSPPAIVVRPLALSQCRSRSATIGQNTSTTS